MIILLGIIILIISFVVALVSMVREQKRIWQNIGNLQRGQEIEKLEDANVALPETTAVPDAVPLDHLRNRVEELRANEAANQESESTNQHVIDPDFDILGAKHRFGSDTTGTIHVADLVREKNQSNGEGDSS